MNVADKLVRFFRKQMSDVKSREPKLGRFFDFGGSSIYRGRIDVVKGIDENVVARRLAVVGVASANVTIAAVDVVESVAASVLTETRAVVGTFVVVTVYASALVNVAASVVSVLDMVVVGGTIVATYSNAPTSALIPCGRVTPSKSTDVVYASFAAPIAGDVLVNRKFESSTLVLACTKSSASTYVVSSSGILRLIEHPTSMLPTTEVAESSHTLKAEYVELRHTIILFVTFMNPTFFAATPATSFGP